MGEFKRLMFDEDEDSSVCLLNKHVFESMIQDNRVQMIEQLIDALAFVLVEIDLNRHRPFV